MKKLLAVLAAGALLVAGCGAASQPSSGSGSSSASTPTTSSQSGSSSSSSSSSGSGGGSADVTALYQQNCQACHGANLEGGVGPALDKVGAKLSEDQIQKQIENGGGTMPGFKSSMKEDDIKALATWLAAKK
ncbi:c-type cytochrome [Kyrpidia tusciae]|uniref:Cytochrome c class I n=1 Tax=Kyrpidia tusciae (strain DSM 2912 / NBRC 15312 / T2) TaxID=562970 RepID=D5WUT8_KYRT2|nr:cytochrome c [Kyrpidia tusciae]ADG07410.1 cytochrome c class I [Kyrpidia tusciae DSM 2912]